MKSLKIQLITMKQLLNLDIPEIKINPSLSLNELLKGNSKTQLRSIITSSIKKNDYDKAALRNRWEEVELY